MQPKGVKGGGKGSEEVGKVVPIALGSGVALKELADEEEKDSGIKAPLLLGAFSAEAEEGAADGDGEAPPELLAADGTPRKPGVKYDAWGRVML